MASSLDAYIRRLKKRQNLSKTRHIELGRIIQRWQQDPNPSPAVEREGRRALNAMVEENSLLAVKLLYKYQHLLQRCCIGVTGEDLLQELLIALHRACLSYDPTRSTTLATVYCWWGSMACARKFLSINRSLIRVSPARLDELRRIANGNGEELSEIHYCALAALRVNSLDVRTEGGLMLADAVAAPEPHEDEDLGAYQELKALHPDECALLERRLLGKASYDQIATELGCRPHHVGGRIREAQQVLQLAAAAA